MIARRPRRNRLTSSIRSLVAETHLSKESLIYPMFICKDGSKEEIASMPGQFRIPMGMLLSEVETLVKLGIEAICLFPKVEESLKDKFANCAMDEKLFYYQAISQIKERFPQVSVMTDVALDPYSSDGHDGVVGDNGEILNDETLDILAKMSLLQAQAGADIIGPSDMMDGRVRVIRKILEENKFSNTLIMSYTAKYCSSFYGPFRDALSSSPKGGDKKTYQMNPSNRKEAIREALLDESEGADILMVKPGIAYLDIVSDLASHSNLPISVYQVSGEYSMIKAAAQKNWINEKDVIMESLMAFKRAGANMILTYFAKDAAKLLA